MCAANPTFFDKTYAIFFWWSILNIMQQIKHLGFTDWWAFEIIFKLKEKVVSTFFVELYDFRLRSVRIWHRCFSFLIEINHWTIFAIVTILKDIFKALFPILFCQCFIIDPFQWVNWISSSISTHDIFPFFRCSSIKLIECFFSKSIPFSLGESVFPSEAWAVRSAHVLVYENLPLMHDLFTLW